jgi:hypothetical protein
MVISDPFFLIFPLIWNIKFVTESLMLLASRLPSLGRLCLKLEKRESFFYYIYRFIIENLIKLG